MMKKNSLYVLVVLMIFLLGCQKDDIIQESSQEQGQEILQGMRECKINDVYYLFDLQYKTVKVKGSFKYCSDSIIIPATINYEGEKFKVTSIEDEAFLGCANLPAITIPASVASIGNAAFADCANLTSVIIPEDSQLASISDYAFYNCESLCSITIPEKVVSIGESAFYNCNFTSITISEKSQLRSIGDCAFNNCRNLFTITIPDNVRLTSIGDEAFYKCSNLTSITIPKGVVSIGSEAFSGCSSLTAVHISDIASWCKINFADNDSNPLCYANNLYLHGELVTELVLPKNIVSIGAYTFYNCDSLIVVKIPEGVMNIGNQAFRGCSNLTAVTIPTSVTSIGDRAFYWCYNLPAIVIPASVTSIGDGAFSYCSNLKSIKVLGVTPPSVHNTPFGYDYNYNAELYVPNEAVDAYGSTYPWSNFASIIGCCP